MQSSSLPLSLYNPTRILDKIQLYITTSHGISLALQSRGVKGLKKWASLNHFTTEASWERERQGKAGHRQLHIDGVWAGHSNTRPRPGHIWPPQLCSTTAVSGPGFPSNMKVWVEKYQISLQDPLLSKSFRANVLLRFILETFVLIRHKKRQKVSHHRSKKHPNKLWYLFFVSGPGGPGWSCCGVWCLPRPGPAHSVRRAGSVTGDLGLPPGARDPGPGHPSHTRWL